MTLTALRDKLRQKASPERAVQSQRFFKTGPGEYGEGDQFLGLTVPQTRAWVPQTDALTKKEVLTLLHSGWHEERLLALFILIRRFKKARKDEAAQQHVIDLYLANTKWVNNWDLVDTSAPHLLGVWLLKRDRSILARLASSNSLWDQRIAVLTTQTFIRAGDYSDTFQLCRRFLTHPHDLMHKACGWMLREIGNRENLELRAFLDQHTSAMPRTMLRYAIEKLPEKDRKAYLARKQIRGLGCPAIRR